ncbi:hypothetical protein [Arsenophonus apicola]|uniref:Uncharacterized protein n=1 Tax=Arsenophonus apicola TaxID=2879119 RepID=A0ABY8P0X8_9GAMM|nr:hypothetical protein [Arsenophonus apicola]WGO82646.1 hypothetical protein QG404_09670 [Arsenophonus apicola]
MEQEAGHKNLGICQISNSKSMLIYYFPAVISVSFNYPGIMFWPLKRSFLIA